MASRTIDKLSDALVFAIPIIAAIVSGNWWLLWFEFMSFLIIFKEIIREAMEEAKNE